MDYELTNNWRKPSWEEKKRIKKIDNKRFINKSKNVILIFGLILAFIYTSVFASFYYKDTNINENILTMGILTVSIIIIINVFTIIYKLLYRHFYGVGHSIEEVNDQVSFQYHHIDGGINEKEQLYVIVLKVDNEQIEILVDKKDYEIINENTKLFLGRYQDETGYKYNVYY